MHLGGVVYTSEDKLWSGMLVEMIIYRTYEEKENGLIAYGYKFRPKLEEV